MTNTTYITGIFSYFIFILFNAKIYTPICLFSFLLVTKCLFLRGSSSQYSNELYLCFLAIFFLSLISILHEHNIKCISYCSVWQLNLLCVILQISSTNFFSSPPFLLLALSFSLVTMILELLGLKERGFWRFFTQWLQLSLG